MNSDNTLQTLMQEWLLKDKKAKVAERTFDKLIRAAKLYIYPNLGNMPVNEINPVTIQTFLSDIKSKDIRLLYATAQNCKSLLNNFFIYCCEKAIISENPMATVSIEENSGREQEKHKRLTPEHMQLFIDAVSSHRFWKPFCSTIMFTGIGIGEILALKWQDIDFERQIIHIENTIAARFDFDKTGKVLQKSHYIQSYRNEQSKRLIMPDNLIKILIEYKNFRQREQREQGQYSYIGENDLVFGNEKSELRSYSGISHLLTKFIKSKDLGDLGITFSTIRHFYNDMITETKAPGQIGLKYYSNTNSDTEKKKIISKYLQTVNKKDFEM